MDGTAERGSGWRRLPWGLIGMLALVVVVERAVHKDELSFSTNAAMSWRYGGKAASRQARRADILCFGDSQVQFEVLPKVLRTKTGRRAYNLGLFAGPPTASFYQLKHALDAGARPSVLVVDFQPNLLETKVEDQARLWPELLTTRDAADLAFTARDASLFARVALGRYLPTYRDRLEVRAVLTSALRGENLRKVNTFWYSPLWRNWKLNDGATVMPVNPNPITALNAAEVAYVSRPWARDPVSARYMRRFLGLAASRKIPVYWMLPPNHPLVQARRDELGMDAEYTQFVRAMQSRYPNVTVVDARRAGFPAEAFADVAHLDRRGSYALTVGVSEILGKPPESGGRWVAPPPYRELPAEVAIEDVTESRIAMKVQP